MQNEIAKDLGFPATTFNTWCMGKVMPKMGKVQKIADYFGIRKTDLVDEKTDGDFDSAYVDSSMKIGLYDERFKKITIAYHNLPKKTGI